MGSLSVARTFALAFAAAMAAVVAYVMVARFGFRHELEWMTGSILDHVERVREGKPIYGPPSADWTPFIYTPGYYWAAAIAGGLLPEIAACRAISIASCLGTAALVHALARRAGASRYYAAVAPLLFVACFGYTSAWYDIERSDTLLVAMLALGARLAQSKRDAASALGGLVVGLGFFVKQPATMFAVLVPVVLLLGGRGRKALLFAAGAAVGLVPLYVILQATTHGWFAFYCVTLPAAHGIAAKYFTLFFVSDLAKAPVLTLATIGVFAAVGRLARGRLARAAPPVIDDGWLVLVAFVLAGFVAAAASRMHVGGWPNVLMFWTTFACPAAMVLASALDDGASPPVRAALALGVALQAGAFVPDPNDAVPDADQETYASALERRVHELESSGEVVLLGKGHVTAKRHPHINALVDVLRANHPLPQDMVSAIVERRWAALVLDDLDDLRMAKLLGHDSPLFDLVSRRYFVAERLDDRAPMPVVGFATVPRWVLRPRRTPLLEASRDELLRREQIEAGYAERNMRAAQADPSRRFDGLEIEDAAAR